MNDTKQKFIKLKKFEDLWFNPTKIPKTYFLWKY